MLVYHRVSIKQREWKQDSTTEKEDSTNHCENWFLFFKDTALRSGFRATNFPWPDRLGLRASGQSMWLSPRGRSFTGDLWQTLPWWILLQNGHMGMDQYLLIPFLGGWTSIYQLFWCSPGAQGFDTLSYVFGWFDIMVCVYVCFWKSSFHEFCTFMMGMLV